ncbi:MAG: glycosyltransferase [Candidatus Krumholzibacteriia bacterium]
MAVNWRDVGDPLGGGAEQHLHHILSAAAAAGHRVDLVVSAYAGAPARDEIDGVQIHRHGPWQVANWVLPRVVRGLLRRARRSGTPYDLLVEDINKIPFYTPLYRDGVPVLAVVPHLFGRTVFREASAPVAAYVHAAELLIPVVYRRCAFEVISPSTRDDLVARGIPAAQIRTVYCGLEHARFALPEPPPRSGTPLLVTWSRLRRYKSVDVALRAFARVRAELPDARLEIMGRGPDERRLRRIAAELGLGGSVAFRGFLPWEDLVGVLHRAHVFLNPSPKEGWGLTVVEANACGLPVVASDAPGLRDSVRDGLTGDLVPVDDDAAFAAAALRLLRDPELWRRRSEAARRWARVFQWRTCAEQSLAIFEAVAARRPLPPIPDPTAEVSG